MHSVTRFVNKEEAFGNGRGISDNILLSRVSNHVRCSQRLRLPTVVNLTVNGTPGDDSIWLSLVSPENGGLEVEGLDSGSKQLQTLKPLKLTAWPETTTIDLSGAEVDSQA